MALTRYLGIVLGFTLAGVSLAQDHGSSRTQQSSALRTPSISTGNSNGEVLELLVEEKDSETDQANSSASGEKVSIPLSKLKKNDPACQAPEGCDNKPFDKNDSRRSVYDKYILEAADQYGVNPALLKAQLHIESSMDPFAENEKEKSAYDEAPRNKKPEMGWGKGLAQFDRRKAASYGLNWDAPKPKESELFSEKLNTPRDAKDAKGNPIKLYSIWSPRGAILAKARLLREIYDEEHRIRLRDANGKILQPERWVRIDVLYKRNPVEAARYISGQYNRGSMPLNSIEEHYRQKHSFPRYYGVAWNTPRIKPGITVSEEEATPPSKVYPILNNENWNRCHVYRMAGLCGDEPQGLFGAYSEDFKLDQKKKWSAKLAPALPVAQEKSPKIEKMLAYALENKKDDDVKKNQCWKYVKHAMIHAGLVNKDELNSNNYIDSLSAVEAHTKGILKKHGYKKLDVTDPYLAPPGAILVYSGGEHGHIEIKTDDGFVSDYFSPNARTGPKNSLGVGPTEGNGRKLVGVYYRSK